MRSRAQFSSLRPDRSPASGPEAMETGLAAEFLAVPSPRPPYCSPKQVSSLSLGRLLPQAGKGSRLLWFPRELATSQSARWTLTKPGTRTSATRTTKEIVEGPSASCDFHALYSILSPMKKVDWMLGATAVAEIYQGVKRARGQYWLVKATHHWTSVSHPMQLHQKSRLFWKPRLLCFSGLGLKKTQARSGIHLFLSI